MPEETRFREGLYTLCRSILSSRGFNIQFAFLTDLYTRLYLHHSERCSEYVSLIPKDSYLELGGEVWGAGSRTEAYLFSKWVSSISWYLAITHLPLADTFYQTSLMCAIELYPVDKILWTFLREFSWQEEYLHYSWHSWTFVKVNYGNYLYSATIHSSLALPQMESFPNFCLN